MVTEIKYSFLGFPLFLPPSVLRADYAPASSSSRMFKKREVVDSKRNLSWYCIYIFSTHKIIFFQILNLGFISFSSLFQECSFNKLHDNTALRVSYQATVEIYSDVRCNRWYFKFNGNECSGPLPIDSMLYTDWYGGISNIHRHHSFGGYCENLARGRVSVEVWIGRCTHHSLGDASTGWQTVSRIMIEEVPPSQ